LLGGVSSARATKEVVGGGGRGREGGWGRRLAGVKHRLHDSTTKTNAGITCAWAWGVDGAGVGEGVREWQQATDKHRRRRN